MLNFILIIAFAFVKYSLGLHDYQRSSFEYADAIDVYLKTNTSEISSKCSDQLHYYLHQLKHNEIWALQLFDANGKIPSGIISGNLYGLGAFDQCLAIEETNASISGQYCLGSIKLNRIFNKTIAEVDELKKDVLVGICMPTGCSAKEITDILNGIDYNVNLIQNSCKVKTETDFKSGALISLVFFTVILSLMVISTVYDVFLHYTARKPNHPLMLAFSILKNGKQLFETNKNGRTQISCLHGFRVLVTLWIVYIHQSKAFDRNGINNLLYVEKVWRRTLPNLLVDATSVSVDTFFVIGGVVVSYNYLNSHLKNIKFNIASYYIHRYLRLTIVLSVMVLIISTLFEHLGSGPLWQNDTGCKQYWWATLLYIHNYVTISPFCMLQTWYLCVDMQLFLLSPLLLIPLGKWPKPTLIAIGLLAVCTTIIIFVTTWILQFSAVSRFNRGSMVNFYNYSVYYYIPTHTRGVPWFLGLILGYYIFQYMRKDMKFTINKIVALLLWVISIAAMLCCIYLSNHFTENVADNRLENALFASLRHPLWSMAVSWIIFACITGYGGPVNSFLSLPIFEVLAKFTYNIYLVHYLIVQIVTNSARTSIEFSDIHLMNMVWGDLIFSLGAAILLALAFEYPALTIEKHFSSKKTV